MGYIYELVELTHTDMVPSPPSPSPPRANKQSFLIGCAICNSRVLKSSQNYLLPPTHNLCRIYEIRSIKRGVKPQFDRIFGRIWYAKIQCLRTFREFCSNPCRSGIRKMKIAAE